MIIGVWIIIIFAGALLLLTFGLSFTRRFTERAAYKFATSVGIGLTEESLPLVRSRLILQQRGAAIAGLLALLAAALFLINNAELTGSTFGSLAFVGILIAGARIVIIVLIKGPQRFFLHRLWPEVEAVG